MYIVVQLFLGLNVIFLYFKPFITNYTLPYPKTTRNKIGTNDEIESQDVLTRCYIRYHN